MMLTQTIPIYPVNKDYFNHFFTQSMKSNYEYPWTLKFYVILKSIEIILNAIKISDAKEGSLCQKVTRFVAFTYEKFEFFMKNYEYNTNFNGESPLLNLLYHNV